MSAFLVTFAVVVAVVAIMAIGVICGRRPIAGSCGGLARLGLECECENPCPKKLARLQAEQARAEAGQNRSGHAAPKL
ncbi:MAG: (Na+)-NQR maturation NqrM [Azoarcus sp.]|nr:(Na+)-NQR maturation NqrM [Azoarcus sp.]